MGCTQDFIVGADAHIGPRRVGLFSRLVEWGNVIYCPVPPFHSTYQVGSVRWRDDVGIVPYIFVGLRSIQRTLHQFSGAFYYTIIPFAMQ